MCSFEESTQVLTDFSGTARLLALPGLVVFPHTTQTLHVSRPLERETVEDAIAGDGLLGVATLAQGWEKSRAQWPPIDEMVCMARIATHSHSGSPREGCTVLLHGLARGRLFKELPASGSLRRGEVELLDDHYPVAGVLGRPRLRRQLLDLFRTIAGNVSGTHEELDHLLGDRVPLGMLSDIIAHTLHLPPSDKQHLLAETNVDLRATWLSDHLSGAVSGSALDGTADFPPAFGEN